MVKTTTHFAKSIMAICTKRGLNNRILSEQIELNESTISKATTGARPHIDTLRAFCTKMPNSDDGLDILIAHLMDEVNRAGRLQPEVDISHSGIPMHETIRILATEAAACPILAANLETMATICMRRPIAEAIETRNIKALENVLLTS